MEPIANTIVGGSLTLFAIVIVGIWLTYRIHRTIYGSRNCWDKTRGADLRREERERERLQKELKKKYRYLNGKKVNK